ncbi:MAG: HEAT repeat domain-containing protein [Planctomycetota bacterium]
MKQLILVVGVLLMGGGAGFLIASSDTLVSRGNGRSDTVERHRRERFEDRRRLDAANAEIARLRALVAKLKQATKEVNPYPDDTPEKVEQLLQEAYAENNVDLLVDIIERLLLMGEKGYPLLRRLIMDLAFKSKFLPSQSDFRPDQFYRFARIFANHERKVIGFLNYLLLEPGTHPYLKQGAMMGGAFYVGSKAPGTEELQQTMMQMFLENTGTQIPGMLPGNIGKKMQVFAMAMSGDPKMIGPLRDELKNTKDKDTQGDIIGALAFLGDPEAVPMIKERLDPMQGDYRSEIRALGRVDSEEAHETASTFLRSIPDSKRFFRHARTYVRSGGGTSAVLLMRERIQANPDDPEVANSIGTLRRYPTQESLDTLNLIANVSPDDKIRERAVDAAAQVDKRLRGEVPEVPKVPK